MSKKDKKFIEEYLLGTFFYNTNRPENIDQLVDLLANDIAETADPDNWHSGDIDIAFRRFVEKATDTLHPILT